MRKDPVASGAFYHIYNRGVNFAPIFFKQKNWAFFLHRLRGYFDPDQAVIIAYCLMPNHYHLLVYVKCENFGKAVMQPFTVSYTKAINKQEGRVGPLFQGPYRAIPVENNRYLIQLSRYIHLNPVRHGFCDSPGDWEFSSYPEYTGLRKGMLPKPDIVLEQFESRQAYIDYVLGWDSAEQLPPELGLDDD